MEDILAWFDQRVQGLRKELNEKIVETQVVLQAVKPFLDTRTKILQKILVDMKKCLHEELGLTFQVESQTTKVQIEASHCEFQTQVKEVEAPVERGRGTGTLRGRGKAI